MDINNQEQSLTDSDEIPLKELILKMQEGWHYILSKWLIILIAGIIGGALGLTYAYLKNPVYKAELSFALQDSKSGGGLGSALGIASQFGIDLGGGSAGGAFSGDNLLELMKSRSMVEKALLSTVSINSKKETLAELYISFNKLRKRWQDEPELKNIQFLPDADRSKFSLKQDSLLGVFYKSLIKSNLTVDKAEKKLDIVSLKVESKNELFSKYFTEVLVKVVADFYVETQTKKESNNVAILQHQTDSTRKALNSAITGVAYSNDVAMNSNPARQILHIPSQYHTVDVEANTAILTELIKNLELAKVTLRQETPLIQVIDRPILPLEVNKVGKLSGLIAGVMISSFLIIIALFVIKRYRNIMSSDDE